MVRLVLDKVYSCLRSRPRLRFCLVSCFFIILLGISDKLFHYSLAKQCGWQ
jgi:hypothetical protein